MRAARPRVAVHWGLMVPIVAATMITAMMGFIVFPMMMLITIVVLLSIMVALSIMVRVVVIVVVVPHVHSVASVFVAPFHFCLEVGPLAVLVALDCVVGVSAPIAKVPCVGIGHASISVVHCA